MGGTLGILDRLFGKSRSAGASRQEDKGPLSLQLLFPGRLWLNSHRLAETLRGFHAELADAKAEVDPRASEGMGATVGLLKWGHHQVRWVGLNAPMPPEVVEKCVAPAHYKAELKAQARAHASHALLYYAGQETDPLEQYVALALVACAMATQGALIILNESGHTSFPAEPLLPEPGDDVLELLRTLPLTALYVGFVKAVISGVPGVWMRTHGADRLGLPDLAWHAQSHDEATQTFQRFSGLLAYLRRSGARFGHGHTVEWNDELLRVREPRKEEAFLHGRGELFVVEKAAR